jgi:hypothetical protein
MITQSHRTQATATIASSNAPTSASAWSSSPLGDPDDASGYLSDPDDFGFDDACSVSKPRSASKVAFAALAAVGAIGGGLLLGAVLFGGGSSHPKTADVVPGASTQSITPNAPDAVPPAAVPEPAPLAPAPDPGQAPAGTTGTDAGAPAAPGVGAPADTDPTDGGSVPAPEAGPGYVPIAPYGPVVVVAPNLDIPGGGDHHNGGTLGVGGGKSGAGSGKSSGGTASGGAQSGSAGSSTLPKFQPQIPIKLPPGPGSIKGPSTLTKLQPQIPIKLPPGKF